MNTETVRRGVKYRVYPNAGQRALISKTFGCARFVYNRMLEESERAHAKGDSFVSRNQFNRRLTSLKQECPWLKEVDSTALTAANDALANAFSNFFSGRANRPRFHRKKAAASYTSKRIKGTGNIRVGSNHVRLPKLGDVKAKIHRNPEPGWNVKSATLSRESDGKYYVSVLFEFEREPAGRVPDMSKAIGLDYASNGLYVDSEGDVGSEHRYYRESQRKLARAQRKLSRKKGSGKGEAKSRNYLKQLEKVNRIHRHMANQRRDSLHKRSREIANRYDIVCVESLDMRSMANKGFGNGKSTMDNGYGMFLSMLEYKLEDQGKLLVKVGKWYPSTQTCHRCGYVNSDLKDLSISEWDCPSCDAHHDRNVNAAINIRDEGLYMLARSIPSSMHGRDGTSRT